MDTSKNYQFLLFISGMSEKSVHAIENLRKIGDEFLIGDYDVEIIDVSKDPHQAQHYDIIGLPTVIKICPDPKRIVLGDLSNKEKVMRIMDIS